MNKIICKTCSKEFEVYPYRRNTAIYCSNSCRGKGQIKKYGHPSTRIKNWGSWSWMKTERGKKTLSKINKDNKYSLGKEPWNKGKEHLAGEKHWNWQGGITSKNTKLHRSKEYKQWQFSVYKRDFYNCQFCGKHCGNDIQAHHIKTWKESQTLRFDTNNGLTLCFGCHLKTRGKEKYYEAICRNLTLLKNNPMYVKNFLQLP